MRDRVAMLDISELYRPEIEVRKEKDDHEYRRYTFDVCSKFELQIGNFGKSKNEIDFKFST